LKSDPLKVHNYTFINNTNEKKVNSRDSVQSFSS
jgi:hypothetical protein